jgi:hypothetical protein
MRTSMKSSYLFLTLLLTACSTPHILNNKHNNTLEITLSDTKTALKMTAKLLYEKRVNLSNINIYQKVYKMENGAYITYEDINVVSGSYFNGGIHSIVHNVFKPNYHYEFIYSKGNIFFYTLTPQDKTKKREYLIVENINKTKLIFVYGFDENGFYKLIDALKNDLELQIPSNISKKPPREDMSSYVISNWNYSNIVLDNLVSKTGSGPRILR